MVKHFYIFLFLTTLSTTTFAQDNVPSKNAVYLDLAGIGGFGSLNYSRHLYAVQRFDFDAFIGISSTKFKDYQTKFNPQVILPFGVHATFGNKHYLELGIGSAYVNSVRANNNFDPERISTINGNASLGYKYQKKQGGFLFRAYYAPIFEQFKTIKHWGGLSLGYAF